MCLSISVIVLLGAGTFMFLSAADTNRGATFGARSQLEDNFDQQNLERRWEKFTQGPKVELISRIAIQNAAQNPYLWLLGNGPGNGLSAIGMTKGSDFAWEYLGDFVQSTDMFKGRGMTSITGSFYSGILSVWSELGAVGYVLYMALYIQLLLHVVWGLSRNQYIEPIQQVMAEGFAMAMLLFIILSFLGDVFYAKYFAGGLWIWAAMVWDPVEPDEGEERAVSEPETADGRRIQRSAGGGQPVPAVNRWQRMPLRK
jgi:hypothetical protein